MMNSRAHKEFEWNDGINFLNIISALFNNWPEMKVSGTLLQVTVFNSVTFIIFFFFKLVIDRTSEDSRNDVYDDIKKFLQNIFDCVLIYGVYLQFSYIFY